MMTQTVARLVFDLNRFHAEESGVTSIEYALIAAGISVVILLSALGIGTALNGIFTDVSTKYPSGG